MILRKSNILIVEDDPDHLAIVEHYLAKCRDRVGDVTAVEDLGAATEVLGGGDIDLVLMDLTLPSSSLEDTIDQIPNLVSFGAAIVALSSLDSRDVELRVRDAGGAGFLAKGAMSESTLQSVLDLIDRAPQQAPDGSGAHVTPPASPAPIDREPAHGIPLAPDELDVHGVASRLTHDVSSWLASMAFRVAALEADAAVQSSEMARDHVASIKQATRVVNTYARAARGLAIDESADVTLEPVDLAAWLRKFSESWSSSLSGTRVEFVIETLPSVEADEVGLRVICGALAENAAAHHGGDGDAPSLSFRALGTDSPGTVTLVVESSGTVWDPKDVSSLGTPVAGGRSDHGRTGLGLVRVGRWMQRMGGAAVAVERQDAPGCYAIRLSFRSAE